MIEVHSGFDSEPFLPLHQLEKTSGERELKDALSGLHRGPRGPLDGPHLEMKQPPRVGMPATARVWGD